MKSNTETKIIPIDDLEPNSWNTNKMNDNEFKRLVNEIVDVGLIDYPQVVQLDSGKYQIVGGEHRWRAAKVAGFTEIPCIVITDEKFKDVDLQKLVSVRLNVIKGKIDPEKFVTLYEEMAKKYGEESLQDLMGFCDKSEWNKLTKGVRQALKDSGISSSTVEKFEESIKEVSTIDGLSTILNKIFNEHGDTIKNNFISFSFGTKDGIFILCEDQETYSTIEALVNEAKEKGKRADLAIGKFLKNWESVGIDDIDATVDDPKTAGAEY